MRKPAFACAKTKTQISCAVIVQLISAFVFTTRIVQSLYFLNPKFQASSHLLWLISLDLVGNPEDRFSHNEAQIMSCLSFSSPPNHNSYMLRFLFHIVQIVVKFLHHLSVKKAVKNEVTEIQINLCHKLIYAVDLKVFPANEARFCQF